MRDLIRNARSAGQLVKRPRRARNCAPRQKGPFRRKQYCVYGSRPPRRISKDKAGAPLERPSSPRDGGRSDQAKHTAGAWDRAGHHVRVRSAEASLRSPILRAQRRPSGLVRSRHSAPPVRQESACENLTQYAFGVAGHLCIRGRGDSFVAPCHAASGRCTGYRRFDGRARRRGPL
jgi:hypothetical protein